MVKKEIGSEDEEETTENTPPRTVIFEGTERTQEEDHRSPPREVIHEETVRTTPVKDRVGLTNREKIKEAQRTKPTKERLGKRPLNRDRRKHVLDRIRSVPEATHLDQTHSVSTRTRNTTTEIREAL